MKTVMQPGTSYDELPYPSHAFVSTSPDRLATIAALFGLSPAPMHNARILELGCSSGGNVLPHAAAFPDVVVHGLDLSPEQIAIGQHSIDRLGLTNATLEVADLRTWRPEAGAWDYIICHGVYSWVSAAIRDAILEICEVGLAPHGVACISFNTEPGWSMQGVVTEAMNYLGRPGDDAHRRAAHARHVLEFLARSLTRTQTPYAATLGRVFTSTRHTTDSYIAHEYLDGFHHPMPLTDFVGQAHQADLQYLGDASLALMLPGLMGEQTHRTLVRHASDVVSAEQYADFLWSRTFRNGLLVRKDAPVQRQLQAFDPRAFTVASRIEPTAVDDTTWELSAPATEVQFQTQHPGLVAFVRLAHKAWPRAVSVSVLAEQAFATMGVPAEAQEGARAAWYQQLGQWLIYGHAMGLVELHRHAYARIAGIAERPEAWSWSRQDAHHSRMPTNLRHEVVPLEPIELYLLYRCDGTRTQAELLAELQATVSTRNLATDSDEPLPSSDDLQAALRSLAVNAFLVERDPSFSQLPQAAEGPPGTPTVARKPSHRPPVAPLDLGRPAAEASPGRMLGLAHMLGLQLPSGPLRILDLHPGSGARRDAIAAELPEAEVRGVDTLEGQQADVIVAWNGLTDWDALRGALAPHGFAVVRLDMRPGWHMLGAVHQMLRFHRSRHHVSIETALEQMGELVLSMPDIDEVPWRRWYEQVAALAASDPELRERLSRQEVDAVTLHEVVAKAGEAGLNYLCDARLPTTSRASLLPEVRAFVLDDLATFGDRIRAEQIGDYTRNVYRRALIFTPQAVPDRLSFETDALRDLCIEPAVDRPEHWCLQPEPLSAMEILAEPDSPPLSRALAEWVTQPSTWDEVRAAFPDSTEEALGQAMLAACEVGATAMRSR